MSLTLSPITDTFVEVGTQEFADLLYDPYLSQTFTSPLDSVPLGTVDVTYGPPPLPISELPPLDMVSSVGSYNYPNLTTKPVLILSPMRPFPMASPRSMLTLPPLPN